MNKFQVLRNIILKKMLLYHVSLGIENEYPYGTGFCVKFNIKIFDQWITKYGILTASHVAQQIRLKLISEQKKFFVLSKPAGRENIACMFVPSFEFHEASKLEFYSKFLHKDPTYTADLAFIEIPVKSIVGIDLFMHSDFFNLDELSDSDSIWEERSLLSGFYRLAGGKIVAKELRNTGDYFGGGEHFAIDIESRVSYWIIPNPKKMHLHGASGSAFWTCYEKNGEIVTVFSGIMIKHAEDFKHVLATSSIYIVQSFLPALKKQIKFYSEFKN